MSGKKLYRPVLEYTRECGKDKQREITSGALYVHTHCLFMINSQKRKEIGMCVFVIYC